MDDFRFKSKSKKDPNCEEYVCQQESLYNKYKSFISKDENFDSSDEFSSPRSECPLQKGTLGYYTWNYLHTMAAYYPLHPTEEEKSLMRNFITSFAHFYPCKVEGRKEFAVWLCQRHNTVNLKLGKELFDCSFESLEKRWRVGDENCSKKTL